jgi:hypothetical protein
MTKVRKVSITLETYRLIKEDEQMNTKLPVNPKLNRSA